MTRIAIFVDDISSVGGEETYASSLIRLFENSYEMRIVTGIPVRNSNLTTERFQFNDKMYYKVIRLGNHRIPYRILNYKELENFDLIYCAHTDFLTIPFLIFFSKVLKLRVIFGLHSYYLIQSPYLHKKFDWVKRYLIKFYLKFMNNIHVINTDDLNKLKKLGFEGNLHYVPNFITHMPEVKANNDHKFTVLLISRLTVDQKGIDFLPGIIEKVMEKERSIDIRVVGGGDGSNIAMNLAAKYQENVHYLGMVDNKLLEEERNNATIFISTSRDETFGLSVLEAQAYGLPCICFDVRGLHDIIKTREQGVLIKPFNLGDFAESILEYYHKWKNGEITAQTKTEIRKAVYKNFAFEFLREDFQNMVESTQ